MRSDPRRQKVEGWWPGVGGGRNGELSLSRYRVSLLIDQKFWRSNAQYLNALNTSELHFSMIF